VIVSIFASPQCSRGFNKEYHLDKALRCISFGLISPVAELHRGVPGQRPRGEVTGEFNLGRAPCGGWSRVRRGFCCRRAASSYLLLCSWRLVAVAAAAVPGRDGGAVMAFGLTTTGADGGGSGRRATGLDPVQFGPIRVEFGSRFRLR
jgi:hypothetical protein